MVRASKYGLMGHSMKDIGETIKQMAEADLFMQTVTFMKANGRMIKPMASEDIITLMEPNTKGTGRKISNMAMARKLGLMGRATKESTKRGRRMAMANSHGQMAPHTKANSWITTSKGLESTLGLITDSIMDFGLTIKCMDVVCLPGQMAENMMESTLMTRSKEMVCSFGLMAGDTRVLGSMESNMAMGTTPQAREKPRRESGKMAKESNG